MCKSRRKNEFLRPRKEKCMTAGEIKIPGPGQKGMLYTRGIMSVRKGVRKSTIQRQTHVYVARMFRLNSQVCSHPLINFSLEL